MMDYFLWPSVLFTLLAGIVAAFVLVKNKPAHHQSSVVVEEEKKADAGVSSQEQHCEHWDESCQLKTVEKRLQTEDKTLEKAKDLNRDDLEEDALVQPTAREEEPGIRSALREYAFSPDAESKPLKYMAGMLRTCQLEKMMTKEELEEEQRVQREQLTAIFQLLKDKQETFGEVTESDLQEQLKLYSI
ncbi:uncharacterized protein LOC100034383 precursor [Danio rerio]|uniref:Uncharacterized protein LOC100034383 precursor n=1 Tax=Danio rerio TaxID=7955 RepID=A0AB13AAS0_DANRE|nr:uncharacterized protein LOC100034383 precursor [Danio rerio]